MVPGEDDYHTGKPVLHRRHHIDAAVGGSDVGIDRGYLPANPRDVSGKMGRAIWSIAATLNMAQRPCKS